MNEIEELPAIEKVERLEDAMRAYEPLDLPVRHYFARGVYAREITIPKGSIVTGKIHKYSQVNILSKGEMSIFTGNDVIRITAPFTIVSPPGTKRAAYAHEECVWTTIHGTHETDVEKIEQTLIAQNSREYLQFKRELLSVPKEEKPCLG